jgi:opacity protein-like surface antigen
MRTHRIWTSLLIGLATLIAAPAQAQQAVSFQFGYNTLRGEDSRTDGDVLVANRELFAFEVSDFNGPTFGGEWTVGLGEYLEAGIGVGYSTRSVNTVYSDYVRPDGREIEQELKLRVTPISFTARVLPFGRNTTVQPYLGGGLGLFNYKYSEVGDFVDFSQGGTITFGTYTADGTQPGLVLLAGLRVPAGDHASLGGEVRWHRAEADLPIEFLGPKLDLGGIQYLGVLQVRF